MARQTKAPSSSLYSDFIAACNKAAERLGVKHWAVGTKLNLFGPPLPGVGTNWEGVWPNLKLTGPWKR